MNLQPIPLYNPHLDLRFYRGPGPELISHPIVRDAVEAHARAETERSAAWADVERLQEKLADAQRQDATDLTDAIEAGRRRPQAKRTIAVEAEIEEAERDANAYNTLVDRKFRALAQALSEHQPEWADETHQHAERKRMEFIAALGTTIEKFGTYAEAAAIDTYVHGGHRALEMIGTPATVTLPNRQTVDLLAAMQAGRSIGAPADSTEAVAAGINPGHLASGEP